jgi:hypothetical protein
MQFQVPQNIAIEDKIVGPLTAIQFGIAVIGGMTSFFIFTSTIIPSLIAQMLGGILALLTLVLAVGRFNDQPMYRFARHIIYFLVRPKVRIWHKGGTESILIRASAPKDTGIHLHTGRSVSRTQIASLAVLLDSRGSAGSVPVAPAPVPAKQPAK